MRLVCYGFADLFIFFDWPFAIWHFERVPPVGVQSSGFKTKIAQHISDARAKVKFRLQQSLCCVITLAVTRCVGWVWGVSRVWGGGPSHGSQKKKKQTADVIGWLSGRVWNNMPSCVELTHFAGVCFLFFLSVFFSNIFLLFFQFVFHPHVTARNNECLMAATSIVCNSQGLFAAAVAVFYFSDFFRKMPDQTDQSILHRPSFPARLHEYAISG